MMGNKEIIKALECCKRDFSMRNCLDCPYNREKSANCVSFMIEDALDLISRQQAEIEDARIGVKSYKGKYESAVKTAKELQTLVDELRHEREVLLEDIHHSADQINEQIEEIERLQTKNEGLRCVIEDLSNNTEYAKAEAIKEYIKTCEKTAISNAAKVAKAILLETGEDK